VLGNAKSTEGENHDLAQEKNQAIVLLANLFLALAANRGGPGKRRRPVAEFSYLARRPLRARARSSG